MRKTRPLVLDGTCQVSCQPRAAVIQAAKPFISRCRRCPAPMRSSDLSLCQGERGGGRRGMSGGNPWDVPAAHMTYVDHPPSLSHPDSELWTGHLVD